jgi:deoxyribodipyrimidine photolyase-related protein
MRHFSRLLVDRGRIVHYVRLEDPDNRGCLAAELAAAVERLQPQELAMTAPGEWRVLQSLKAVADQCGGDLNVHEDRHVFASAHDFAAHAAGRKQLHMEYLYREMRKRHAVLTNGDEPAGGRWNHDAENRAAFATSGPANVPAPVRFAPDAITRAAIALVDDRFAQHPGDLADFAWPGDTRAGTSIACSLRDRAPALLRAPAGRHVAPRAVAVAFALVRGAESQPVEPARNSRRRRSRLPCRAGAAGERRGVHQTDTGLARVRLGHLLDANARLPGTQRARGREPLPQLYWTGKTSMACLADAIGQTLRHGYAHHIQRLMITGLYALLLGVDPKAVHAWYLAVYVDAVEWVELPNTLGMSQAADDGLMASKPYIASGKYIERMSHGSLCARCRFDPNERTGARTCPLTTLYWDFLMRHEKRLAANARTVMQTRNLARMGEAERARIARRAADIRAGALDESGSCSQ